MNPLLEHQRHLGRVLVGIGAVARDLGLEAFGSSLIEEAAEGRQIDLGALSAFIRYDRRFACQVVRGSLTADGRRFTQMPEAEQRSDFAVTNQQSGVNQ